MNKFKTLLKWWGGKYYLSSWIRSHAPEHKHRVYVCAGGLGEAWNWDSEGISEVANDVFLYLTNFYKVMQSEPLFAEFRRRIEATPFSEVEWRNSDQAFQDLEVEGPGQPADLLRNPSVDLAVHFFVWNRQSLTGRMSAFTSITRRRSRSGMNAEASAWWGAVAMLEEFHHRLKRILIRELDFAELIRQEDTPDTLFYVDPPYLVGEHRSSIGAYRHEFDREDHIRLLASLADVEGKVMLSGYPSELYDSVLLSDDRWRKVTISIDNKAQMADTKCTKTETLWCNFPISKG